MTIASSPLRITRLKNLDPPSWIAPIMCSSLPLVSISIPMVIGSALSAEKKAIFCSVLSSRILKSSFFSPVTIRLFLLRTVAKTLTKPTSLRMPGS